MGVRFLVLCVWLLGLVGSLVWLGGVVFLFDWFVLFFSPYWFIEAKAVLGAVSGFYDL